MRNTIIIALFVITTGLCLFSCKPVHAPLQQDYIHQMLGRHTWAGTENDSLLPDTIIKAPGHDTVYTVALNTSISFVNNNTVYLSTDSGSSYNNFRACSFYYLSTNTPTQTMLFYYTNDCCGFIIKDTLIYNYAANSMLLMQHFEDNTGIYTMNMHSP